MKKLLFVIPCKGNSFKYIKDWEEAIAVAKLVQGINVNAHFEMMCNNKKPMLEALLSARSSYSYSDCDYVFCVHDDLQIIDKNFVKKAVEAFIMYDYWGVAGTNMLYLGQPRWHIPISPMKENFGLMEHASKEGHRYVSFYGRYPASAVVFDGVFMAFTKKVFDSIENVSDLNGFHMYDMEMCTQASVSGAKGGVIGLHLFHDSRGEGINTKEWEEAANVYTARWANKGVKILKV
jgi:GT2 family glycosyltransferase